MFLKQFVKFLEWLKSPWQFVSLSLWTWHF